MDLSYASTTIGRWVAVGAATAVLSAVLTRAYIALARARKFTAPADPWHDQPVAQAGGVAVWAAIAVAAVVLGLHRDRLVGPGLLAGLLLAVVGHVDDRKPLQPNAKLLTQFAIGVALIAVTYRVAPTPVHVALFIPVAALWLAGQSNALNLLDNMDGMCPAVAGVSALGIAVVQAQNGAVAPMTFAIIIAGACFGFLVWNRKPARVFLGDTGSLALGLVLAFLAMQGSWRGAGASWGRLALPVLLLGVPLLNTFFVIVTRHDAGVPVSRGLADHVNYRLVAHGFAPNQAVLILCAVAASGAIMALLFPVLPWTAWACVLALFTLLAAYFAIFLSHANVEAMYAKLKVPRTLPPTSLYLNQRRRVFEIMSDATLASAAYFLSFQLRFDANLSEVQEHNLVRGVPVVILAAVAAHGCAGSTGCSGKYMGGREAIGIVKSSVLASAMLYLATRLPFFGDYPRSIYILFAMVFFFLATGIPRLAPDDARVEKGAPRSRRVARGPQGAHRGGGRRRGAGARATCATARRGRPAGSSMTTPRRSGCASTASRCSRRRARWSTSRRRSGSTRSSSPCRARPRRSGRGSRGSARSSTSPCESSTCRSRQRRSRRLRCGSDAVPQNSSPCPPQNSSPCPPSSQARRGEREPQRMRTLSRPPRLACEAGGRGGGVSSDAGARGGGVSSDAGARAGAWFGSG